MTENLSFGENPKGCSLDEKKDILDNAARLAVVGARRNIATAQINNLIEFIQALSDEPISLLYLSAFVMRQAARKAIPYDFAIQLKNILINFYERGCSRGEALKLLGVVKWLTEGISVSRQRPRDARSFEKLIEQLG